FWSKDEIIWGAFAGPAPHPVLGVIGYAAAGLTAFYMGRLLFLTFFGTSRADHHTQEHVHESPAVMTIPLIILAVLAVVGGYFPPTHLGRPVAGEGHVQHAPPATDRRARTLAPRGGPPRRGPYRRPT